LFASVNHGTPAVAATAKPGVFSGAGVVAPKGFNGTANKNALGTTFPGAVKSVTNTTGSTTSNSNGALPTDHKRPVNQFAPGANPAKGAHPGPHGSPNQHAHDKGPRKPDRPKNG